MQPSKWEVWPWNWRKVRRGRISKEDRDLFERYGEAVIGSVLAGNVAPAAPELQAILHHYDDAARRGVDKFAEARNWLTECRDSQHRREQRLEAVEIGVVVLITLEIILSLVFGFVAIRDSRDQARILAHMDTSTAASAEAMQTVRDELKSFAADQAKIREILQQQEADRQAQAAKKPRLALYVGSMPIDKATIRLAARPGNAQDVASIALTVKNVGHAPLSTFRLHAHAPAEVMLNLETLMTLPQSELPPNPNTQRVTLQLPPLPAGETVRIGGGIYAPKGHSAFKITFTADAFELQPVAPLGSLTVLPPKP